MKNSTLTFGLLLTLFLITTSLYSQELNWSYTDPTYSRASDAHFALDGHVMVLGQTKEYKSITKIGLDGVLDWGQEINVESHYSAAFCTNSSGELFTICGSWDSLIVLKHSDDGDLLYQKRTLFQGQGESTRAGISAVIPLSTNEFLVGGHIQGTRGIFGNAFNDLLLMKIDAAGNYKTLPWIQATWGTVNIIKKDPAGDIICVGTFLDTIKIGPITLLREPFTAATTFITKLNEMGEVLWATTSSTPRHGYDLQIYGIDIDGQGNIYLAGERAYNPVIQKINSAGELLLEIEAHRFQNQHGSARWSDVTVNNLGEIFVSGILNRKMMFGDTILSATDDWYHDYLIAQYDSTGQLIWIRKSTEIMSERLIAILPSYSSIVVVGEINGEDPTFNSSISYANLYVASFKDNRLEQQVECSTFSLFPNPTTGELWFGLTQYPKADVSVTLYDARGKRLNTIEFDHEGKYLNINLSNYAKGVYYIGTNQEGNCEPKKLILH